MAFEAIKAELDILLEKMINQPQDAFELEMLMRQKLNAVKAEGLPVPEDLAEFEKKLDDRLRAQKG